MEKLFKTIKAKWVFFLIYIIVVLSSLAIAFSLLPTDYQTKMKIFTTPSSNSSLANIYDAPYTDRAVKTVSVLISGDAIINEIASSTGLEAGEIKASYSTRNIPGTQVIEITVKNKSSQNATSIAQNLPASIDGLLKTIQADTDERNQIRVAVAEEASQPIADSSGKTKEVGIFFLVAIAIGYLLTLLLDPDNNMLKTTLDIEKNGDTVLGRFCHMEEVGNDFDKILSNKDSHLAESLREIRTNIIFDEKNSKMKTIAISSPSGYEGKTSFAAALGMILAEASKRVVIIDADIRKSKPNMYKGLTDYFNGNLNNEELIYKTNTENLWYIYAGNPGNFHLSTLFSKRNFGDLKKWLLDTCKMDYILLDSPSIKATSDISVIAKNSDGVIIVTEHGKTLKKDYQEAKKVLRRASANIFGVVVSKFKLKKSER